MGLSNGARAASLVSCLVAALQVGLPALAADELVESSAAPAAAPVKVVNEKILPLVNEAYKSLGKGESEKAIKTLQKALLIDPDSVTARRYLAYALVTSGAHTDALKQMQELSKLTASNPFDWYIFGEAYFGAGHNKHALTCYMRSLNLSPSYHAARGGAVKVLAGMGQFQKALDQVQLGSVYATDPVVKKYYVSLRQGVIDAEAFRHESAQYGSRDGMTQEAMEEHGSKPIVINPSMSDPEN